MKRKIIIAAGIFAGAAVLILPIFAAALHHLLSRDPAAVTIDPVACWQLLLQGGAPARLYALLCAVVALLLGWILFSSTYLHYRSDMQQITPEIQTPCADGQGQYGTARWMDPKGLDRAFGHWKIPEEALGLKELLAAGEQDRKEIENAKIEIDSQPAG